MTPVPPQLLSALADRYEFERELGRGGMATVYLAQDLRHHRSVAVKVMDPDIANPISAQRFLREIEIASGLTHPHILPVHDSGEISGQLFYVMPFVDGESLKQRLDRDEPIRLDEALRITAEVANGLDYAHQHGVVHRDVKPGNILLADGHAYIADFGIARTLNVDLTTDLTKTGLALGTPSYMSPEQASGERDIDGRADIYALACVLYEMLSGSLPFTGSNPQAILVKRITEVPRPIRQIRKEVPPGVERALHKALATGKEDRYETAGAFADSLVPAAGVARRASSVLRRVRYGMRKRLAGHPVLAAILGAAGLAIVWAVMRLGGLTPGGTGPIGAGGTAPGDAGETTIAVLYFDDLSTDGSLDAYSRGFTEALIRRINSVPGLVAPSLLAVRRFRDGQASPDSIARVLGADFLVEGSILGSQQALRVNVGLVDPVTGMPVGQSFVQGAGGDLIDLVDGVSDSLSQFLRPVVGEEVRLRELRGATDSDEAWDLVWRAEALRESHNALVEASEREQADQLLAQADSLLALAESLDPTWTEPVILRGWVAVDRALVFAEEAGEFDAEDRPLVNAALERADRALSLDPENADALELRGTAKFGLARTELNETARNALLDEAERDLRAAGEASNMQAEAWAQLGVLLHYFKADFAGAKRAYDRALGSDPFLREAGDMALVFGSLSTDLEEYDEAWTWYREGRRRWPENVGFPALGLMTLASTSGLGGPEAARALADTIVQTMPLDRYAEYEPMWEAQVSTVLWRAGLQDSARTVLLRAETINGGSSFAAYYLAYGWLVQGDLERCFYWLEIDLEANPGEKAYRATEPWFRPLHGNPRFQKLVRVEGAESG